MRIFEWVGDIVSLDKKQTMVRSVILGEISTRLLKVLWIFNILLIFGSSVLIFIAFVGNLIERDGFYGFGEGLTHIIGINLIATAILVFLQYVLLGNFNPKILFKRESRDSR